MRTESIVHRKKKKLLQLAVASCNRVSQRSQLSSHVIISNDANSVNTSAERQILLKQEKNVNSLIFNQD